MWIYRYKWKQLQKQLSDKDVVDMAENYATNRDQYEDINDMYINFTVNNCLKDDIDVDNLCFYGWGFFDEECFSKMPTCLRAHLRMVSECANDQMYLESYILCPKDEIETVQTYIKEARKRQEEARAEGKFRSSLKAKGANRKRRAAR